MKQYQKKLDQLYTEFSSGENGLSTEQAVKNCEKFGRNVITEGKKKSIPVIFLEQYKDFLVLILIIAAIVSAFMKDVESCAVILVVITMNAILGTVQTVKAEKSLTNLKKLSAPTAKALRNGEKVIIPSEEIAVGDILLIEAGDQICADGRLIECASVQVNESALTGESVNIDKDMSDIEGEKPLAERANMVYSGSFVTYGRGKMLVTEVGMDTEVGKIASLIQNASERKTPLQNTLDEFGKKLSIAILIVCAVVFGLSVLRGGKLMDSFMFAIALAVAAIPEALSSIVTIVLSFGTQKMSKENAIIRKLQAVEGLGSVSVICSDKTGTLTKAQPTVAKIVSFNDQSEDELLRIAACLEEHFPHSMAKAVVREAVNRNLVHEELHSKVEYIVAHGISSKIGEKHIVIGSYHFVFEDENATIPEGKKTIFEQLPEQYSHLYMAIDGVLVAVICIEDPLRPEAVEVIAKLKKLGISKVVMMTGDSDRVASVIAKKVGVDEYHSEVLPEGKASFVEAEKNAGRKVIMVGDGINDSPALSAADVGIAISDGAQIAREIADVTVGADDLHELVTLKKISNGLMERIHRNYRLIVGSNTSLIVLGVAGVFPPTTSALLHNTSTLLISLKSMNNLLDEKEEVTEENVAEAFA